MKFLFESFLLFCVLSLSGQTKDRVLGLEELFALADTESKSLKVFEAAVAEAEQDIAVAKNDYLPEVVFSASASYNGNAWVADRDFSNGQWYSSPHLGNSFALEASQVIFAGGAIANTVKALEIRKKMAQWDLAARRQEVYFLLAGYYLDLYKYRNLLTVYDRNIEQTRQVIRDMQAREAAGVVLNNDITRYEVQYQNLQYKRTELLSSIAIYNDKIVTMLELPSQTRIYPDTTLLHRSMPEKSEGDYLDMALEKAPLLNRNRLALQALDRQEKVAKAAYLPQVNLMAGDNLKGPITYEIPTLNNNINTWYIGVGLRYDIGALYKAPKIVSRLRASIDRANAELDLSEEDLAHAVRAAYIRYLDSFELLKTQEKSLQLARENYEVTSNRYANDLVLVTDLVDADNLRLAAEVQYVNAQINVIYSYCELLYTTGSLHSVNNGYEL